MSSSAPTKQELTAVFTKLKANTPNKSCFDCGARNPSWVSITYGVFICIDCSAVHRGLGVHISCVRSSELDTKWNWTQLRAMQVGGNALAHQFFNEHNCTSKDSQQKYSSRAAQLYRDKLSQIVANSLKMYGNCVELPSTTSSNTSVTTPKPNPSDFWSEHEKDDSTGLGKASMASAGSALKSRSTPTDASIGPNVSLANAVNESATKEYKPSLIGSKKPNVKKGISKKGMGAQKVMTDFNKLEEDAIKADQMRDNFSKNIKNTETVLNEEEAEERIESIRLAYQDLSDKQKQSEEKMRSIDPNKADQMERLGMGFSGSRSKNSGVSHSAVSDMKTIEQIPNPNSSRNSKLMEKEMERELMMLELGFSSGPPKYKDTPFGKSDYKSHSENDFEDFWSDFEKPVNKKPDILDSIETIDFEHSRSQPKIRDNNSSHSSGSDAQQKFGDAKAISSDQFFDGKKDSEFEQRTTLNRFQGSNSISSDDYFGRQSSQNSRTTMSSISGSNLYDIKEGVRDGVTQVAGRLSNLASNVMSSLQEKYGGY